MCACESFIALLNGIHEHEECNGYVENPKFTQMNSQHKATSMIMSMAFCSLGSMKKGTVIRAILWNE